MSTTSGRSADAEDNSAPRSARTGSAAVAAGIVLSRLSGLAREIAVSGFLGIGAAADAFKAALRIPNVVQNLLGEGTLSASFIPVYSRLVADGEHRRAGRTAGAVFGLLVAVAGALSLAIAALAVPITAVLTPGFDGETRDLTAELIRIMAPGTTFLVLSAWCLGILNSHRRFFLSYVAPVAWNATQIAVVLVVGFRQWQPDDIAIALGWAVLAGGLIQFLIQVRPVLGVAPAIGFAWRTVHEPVRAVITRFGPAVLGRGAVQISAFVDTLLASLLITGALSALFAAQVLYILPISLFAMSVAAAELPAMSTMDSDQDVARRATVAQRRIAFFLGFVTVAYIAAGDVIVGALFERGRFSPDDTLGVWIILAAYTLGLPAAGSSRLLQNVAYALGDTRGPARIAAQRVALAAVIGAALMFPLDEVAVRFGDLIVPGDPEAIAKSSDPDALDRSSAMFLGAAGLALGSAIASWYELWALRRYLGARMDTLPSPLSPLARLAVPAGVAFLVASVAKAVTTSVPLLLAMPLVLGAAGACYVILAFRRGITESELVLGPVRRILWRR